MIKKMICINIEGLYYNSSDSGYIEVGKVYEIDTDYDNDELYKVDLNGTSSGCYKWRFVDLNECRNYKLNRVML